MTGSESAAWPWNTHPLADGERLRLETGPLGLDLERRGKEVRIAPIRARVEGEAGSLDWDWSEPAPTADIEWTRWDLGRAGGEIKLTPRLPDRPVVVRPMAPFRLAPGARARLYVRVPLWARVDDPGSPPRELLETPTRVLSNTWFGSFTEGEACFGIRSRVRMDWDDVLLAPHLAACPVEVRNLSQEALPVERFCLRMERLSLYRAARGLWANLTRIDSTGPDYDASVEVVGGPPSEASGAPSVSPPRQEGARHIVARTFSVLRALPGFGF